MLTELPLSVWLRKQRSWKALKRRIEEATLKEIAEETVGKQARTVVQKGYKITNIWLNQLMKDPERIARMSSQDVKFINDMVFGAHKVKQLEEGRPTDIRAYEGFSVSELKEYLLKVAKEMESSHGDVIELFDDGSGKTSRQKLLEQSPTDYIEVSVSEKANVNESP